MRHYWLIGLLLISSGVFATTHIAEGEYNRVGAYPGVHTFKVFRDKPFAYKWFFDCENGPNLNHASGIAKGHWFAKPNAGIQLDIQAKTCNRLKVLTYSLEEDASDEEPIVYEWEISGSWRWPVKVEIELD